MTLEELQSKRDEVDNDLTAVNSEWNALHKQFNEKKVPLRERMDALAKARSDLDRQVFEKSAPPVDRSNQCTTDGRSPEEVRAEQRGDPEAGQHKSYVVLCDAEREKGFVRPVRCTYVHVGEGGHEVDPNNPSKSGLKGNGCGVATSMGDKLAETYARDPKFYTSTFCAGCNKHFPVSEFVWDDGEVLGS